MSNKIHIRAHKLLLILLITLMLLNQSIKAQIPPAVPKMWVSERISKEREALFGIKKEILDAAIGGGLHPAKYFFTTTSIKKLIDRIKSNYSPSIKDQGIRIYIGAPEARQEPSSSVGSIKKNQLVLIFAPTEDKMDIGKYYTVNKNDFTVHEIAETTKKNWTENYVNNIIGDKSKGLASTIEDSPENYVNSKLSDTRLIYYSYDNFVEFLQREKDYQDSHSPDKISGYNFYFAAYNSSGIGCNAHREEEDKFKYRLLLIVEFTKKKNGTNKNFYIDKTDDFEMRDKPRCPNGGKAVTGGDNGQLCPPSTNCPTERH